MKFQLKLISPGSRLTTPTTTTLNRILKIPRYPLKERLQRYLPLQGWKSYKLYKWFKYSWSVLKPTLETSQKSKDLRSKLLDKFPSRNVTGVISTYHISWEFLVEPPALSLPNMKKMRGLSCPDEVSLSTTSYFPPPPLPQSQLHHQLICL